MNKRVDNSVIAPLIADFYLFFQWAWLQISNEPLTLNWHIKEICRELQFLSQFIIKRLPPPYLELFIEVPPGSTKSSICSQSWPVWCYLQDPSLIFIVDSYSADASLNHSVKAKAIIKSDGFNQFFNPYIKVKFGKQFELTRDNGADWINNFGGRYFSTSTTGTVTSMHAHCLIFDDPMNAVISDSESKRIASNRAYDLTFPTRKINKDTTPSVFISQRLNEEDTIGHVKARSTSYKEICLPAELSDNISPEYLKEKYIDGLLDPIRLSRTILEKSKTDLGSFGYAGQFLQQPYPEEGGHIKKEWFMFCDEVPDNIAYDLWIDGAYTDKAKNDPTGFMICGFDVARGRLYIKHYESDWLIIPDVIKKVKSLILTKGDQSSMIFVEPKASGYSFIQMIQEETYFNVTRITGRLVQDGKMARVKYAAPKVESSRVYLLQANWNSEFITQLTAFPNYTHDEVPDLLGYAVKRYFG